MLPYPRGSGAHAEYVTGPARVFARKPGNIDHIQAAALPLAGLTAWQSLVNTADVQPGQRVLIHAAAGGVGYLAVQIAKARGAYVIGTASERNHVLLRNLGADEVIDYRTTDFVIRTEVILVEADYCGMKAIAGLVAEGRLGPVVAGVFPLDNAAAAHTVGEAGHVAGKLVLTVEPGHGGQ
jgi:NADPH:quinone reductase-like Zn-dependent oxidoreductase